MERKGFTFWNSLPVVQTSNRPNLSEGTQISGSAYLHSVRFEPRQAIAIVREDIRKQCDRRRRGGA
jgi:hypothetical protein